MSKRTLAEINADLAWWEDAFGEGNVIGWTFRNTAIALVGKVHRTVYATDRDAYLGAKRATPADARIRELEAAIRAKAPHLRADLGISKEGEE